MDEGEWTKASSGWPVAIKHLGNGDWKATLDAGRFSIS
jgi:hypothetical protein